MDKEERRRRNSFLGFDTVSDILFRSLALAVECVWPRFSCCACTLARVYVCGIAQCGSGLELGGYLGARNRSDKLRSVLGNALILVLLADHEASDVLEEE